MKSLVVSIGGNDYVVEYKKELVSGCVVYIIVVKDPLLISSCGPVFSILYKLSNSPVVWHSWEYSDSANTIKQAISAALIDVENPNLF